MYRADYVITLARLSVREAFPQVDFDDPRRRVR
jgi:hypothetical protein